MSEPGAFIISLDFELHWGVFDHTPLNDRSRAYFQRTRALLPPTLDLFARHGIRATWATVGMLFATDREELLSVVPTEKPAYTNRRFDPYRLLHEVGADEEEDPYHYAPSLIARIADTPGQEIASHTFGHYYCLEAGQTLESFRADLAAAQRMMRLRNLPPARALVFPRNQFRPDYFPALRDHGFITYRGNPDQWFWRVRAGEDTTLRQRGVRLLDNYLPLPATTTLFGPGYDSGDPRNVPASRFLRPYLPKIDGYGGQHFKVRRILREMRTAACNGLHYHLWWHPHNLATDPARNMAALEAVVHNYSELRERYGWRSHSMDSFARSPSLPQF